MMIACQASDPYQFLSLARSSLIEAQKLSLQSLPVASALLAQVEGSLGSKQKWEKSLRAEWFSWPPGPLPTLLYIFPIIIMTEDKKKSTNSTTHLVIFTEMKPAEVYFQMHLLAIQDISAASNQDANNIESSLNPTSLVLRAIHLNPSCRRYWKVLQN